MRQTHGSGQMLCVPAKKRHNTFKPSDILNTPSLQLYVDGSFDPALKRGGWGLVVLKDTVEIGSLSGGANIFDNSAMELEALLAGMFWLEQNAPTEPAIIWSDAVYAVKGCNEWRHMRKSNSWKRRIANGKGRFRAIPNAELWKKIDLHLTQNPLTVVSWCKGHAGHSWNEKADELAQQGRLSLGT